MARLPLSVTIICKNEEDKIRDALRSVQFADEVVVVDSGSTDRTLEIAREEGARVLVHEWQGYGQQKNYAQDQTRHLWVLNIDADERVSPELKARVEELLQGEPPADGFEFPRKNFYGNRWIRFGGWYPNYQVRMARKDRARWTEPKVHEFLKVEGKVHRINAPIEHPSFGGVHDQVLTNVRFSRLGMEELLVQGKPASIFRLLLKSWWKFIDSYFLKQGFRDGLPGFIIAVNAAHSMFMKYAALLEVRRENTDHR
jgi:glycosyltransferase involved in cell wall biosynthesis